MDPSLREKLEEKLPSVTKENWTIYPLHVEFLGAHQVKPVKA